MHAWSADPACRVHAADKKRGASAEINRYSFDVALAVTRKRRVPLVLSPAPKTHNLCRFINDYHIDGSTSASLERDINARFFEVEAHVPFGGCVHHAAAKGPAAAYL